MVIIDALLPTCAIISLSGNVGIVYL